MNWVPDSRLSTRTLDPLIWHLNGVSWRETKIPRRLHRCQPKTKAIIALDRVYRCRCGAIAFDRPVHWTERNSRRRNNR